MAHRPQETNNYQSAHTHLTSWLIFHTLNNGIGNFCSCWTTCTMCFNKCEWFCVKWGIIIFSSHNTWCIEYLWKPHSKKVFVVLMFGFTDHLAACFIGDLRLRKYMRWNQNRDAFSGFAFAWGLWKSVLFLDGRHHKSKIVLLIKCVHVDRKILLVIQSL